MQLDDRDIICETDYSPLSNAELAAQIEWHASAMSGATAYDLERITGPARALLARAEAAEASREALADRLVFEMEQRETLAARAEAAERERDDANIEVALEQANAREAWERVAELEAQLAAQQWRPVTEEPTAVDSYLVYRAMLPRDEPWYFEFGIWDDDGWDIDGVTHWRPLPPAP